MPILVMPKAERGCGERKEGGTYIYCEAGVAVDCKRLPVSLTTCPCCGEQIRRLRSVRVFNPSKFWGNCTAYVEEHPCHDLACPVCFPPDKAGLMWIGKKFYATPEDFIGEAHKMGVSKRVPFLPEDLKIGDRLYLVHPKAFSDKDELGDKVARYEQAGIVMVTRVTGFHRIITEKDLEDPKKLKAIEEAGITPVLERVGIGEAFTLDYEDEAAEVLEE